MKRVYIATAGAAVVLPALAALVMAPAWMTDVAPPRAPAAVLEDRAGTAPAARRHKILCALIAAQEREIDRVQEVAGSPTLSRQVTFERRRDARADVMDLQRARLRRIEDYNALGFTHHPRFNGTPDSSLPLTIRHDPYTGLNPTRC